MEDLTEDFEIIMKTRSLGVPPLKILGVILHYSQLKVRYSDNFLPEAAEKFKHQTLRINSSNF